MFSRSTCLGLRRKGAVASLVLLASGVAGTLLPTASYAQQEPSQFRSITDVRPRIPDEHDRPYFRETQSHRGFEVREDQFTVIASTSRDDARWAAGQVSIAWQNASRLSQYWTDVTRNPDFGLHALQVAINSEPIHSRDEPATTINVLGIQTQVQIHVGSGQPPLAEQVVRLREGAAFAMLHTAGVDGAAPPWVVAGLAGFAGRQGLPEEESKADRSDELQAHLGGQQWRFARSASDVLDYQHLDHVESRDRVAFLLTGDDAAHAPLLLDRLHDATADATTAAAQGGAFRAFPGDTQPAPIATSFDGLIEQFQSQFEAWKKNPLAGQPVFEPAADAQPELVAAERDMLVLLKLHRRYSAASAAQTGARMKIVTFDRAKGAATEPSKRSTLPISFRSLVARLTDPTQPAWATLDVDGGLLLSSDAARVEQLLNGDGASYLFEDRSEGTVLVRRLDQYHQLRGWLAENPKDKTRPLAKFEFVDLRTKAKVKSAASDGKNQALKPHLNSSER
jgi:hypothetical protein